MRYGPITVRDKTGREILLRNAEPDDAEALLRYLKTTAAETRFLVREPEEITLSVEAERQFIEGKIAAERELMIVAFAEGEHVGNCSLMEVGGARRYRHRCSVGIALYRAYWGRGIGRIMLETVLRTAAELGYEQAELEAVADNHAAVALYEKLGFRRYGVFPDNMKYKDGTYADGIWMMKKL